MSNIRSKRAARRKPILPKSTSVLYDELIDGSNPTLIIEDAIEETINDVVESSTGIQHYDYQAMSNLYTENNPAQQLGNYRSAMDYLCYYTTNVTRENMLLDRLKDLIYDFPNCDISSYASKQNGAIHSWVISQMINVFAKKYLGTVYVLDGGIGLLSAGFLDSSLVFQNIRSFDLNPTGQFMADSLMKNELLEDWRFKSTTQDIFNLDYVKNEFITTLPDGSLSNPFDEIPNVIINTNISSIENYEDWWKMIPTGRHVVLVATGNEESVRPFLSSIAFNRKFQLKTELYSGNQKINGINYYMKIGIK